MPPGHSLALMLLVTCCAAVSIAEWVLSAVPTKLEFAIFSALIWIPPMNDDQKNGFLLTD